MTLREKGGRVRSGEHHITMQRNTSTLKLLADVAQYCIVRYSSSIQRKLNTLSYTGWYCNKTHSTKGGRKLGSENQKAKNLYYKIKEKQFS